MMEEEVVVDLGSLPLALNIFIGLLIAVEGVAQQTQQTGFTHQCC